MELPLRVGGEGIIGKERGLGESEREREEGG